VCSNGYGHLKRVLSVVNVIVKKKTHININIFCSRVHKEFVLNQSNFYVSSDVNFITELSDNEPAFTSQNGLTLARYDKWCADLSQNKILKQSHLIISDNHITPAFFFKQVMLMGSFLWSDVNQFKSDDIIKINLKEKTFLQTNPIEVMCLKAMAMESLKKQTRPIFLPWFCSKYNKRHIYKKENSILVTGGGTAILNDKIIQICKHLIKNDENLNLFLDSNLFKLIENHNSTKIKLFDFTNASFAKLKAILCRPGIGILTDCVRYAIPPICLHDNSNDEIAHNSNRIKSLGLGTFIEINNQKSISNISSLIQKIINNSIQLKKFQYLLNKQQTGGATKAANYILKKLYDK
jgi:hypothetical protein